MRFVTYTAKGRQFPGVLTPDGRRILPLCQAGLPYETLEALARFSTAEELAALSDTLRRHPEAGEPLETVTLLPAIPRPSQEVLVMENNFCADDRELARFLEEKDSLLPTYYYKKATFSSVSGGRIPTYPGHVAELDYQAELRAVVAGDVYQVTEAEAAGRIFGYMMINNVTARDLTRRHRRPYIATSLDGFLPMGSCLVTPEEVGEVIRIRSYVNGELRQDSDTRYAKFGFAYAIADLSRISVLRGGSILTLGTPPGSGCHQQPPRYLRSGDVVTCEAEGIGSVTSMVE